MGDMKRRIMTCLLIAFALFHAIHAWAQSDRAQHSIGSLTYSIPSYLEFQEVDTGGMKWHFHSDEASSITYSVTCADMSSFDQDEDAAQRSADYGAVVRLTANESFLDNLVWEPDETDGQMSIRYKSNGIVDDIEAYMTGISFKHEDQLYNLQQIVTVQSDDTAAEFESIVASFQY